MASIRVLIATYLEPEYVYQIERSSPNVEVLYRPDILPQARYRGDHDATRATPNDAESLEWRSLLRVADVLFDFDWLEPEELPTNAPNLRWVQATRSGVDGFMRRHKLAGLDFVVTTAAGINATPLAEFALAGALYFTKQLPLLEMSQAQRTWVRFTSERFEGKRVTVIGPGHVGSEVINKCLALRAQVCAVSSSDKTHNLPSSVEQISVGRLDSVLPRTDILILCCALTDSTRNLIDSRRLGLLPTHAVLINVSRGEVVDEDALADCLRYRRIRGACLDVTVVEPLPDTSTLWGLDNLLLSPHSASTTATENRELTSLFLRNLHHWQNGEPMENVYDAGRGY